MPPVSAPYLAQVERLPALRYMGSKRRLLPWIAEVVAGLSCRTSLDAFCGSGSVAYLLKTMGLQVASNDALRFCHEISRATLVNDSQQLSAEQIEHLLTPFPNAGPGFIERTYDGIFFTTADLRTLDTIWRRLEAWPPGGQRSLAIAAMVRSAAKRQPRGVFTVAGDPERYKDGRRDLRLSVEQHFREGVEAYNRAVFDNGQRHLAHRGDIFALQLDTAPDLVYLDPPYVPRSDDNCYIKRYHFLEGLASGWRAPEIEILQESKVKKLKKRRTPFGYRHSALDAFRRLFQQFRSSTLLLSYSSNGYPDLDELRRLMLEAKGQVHVYERQHRYSFGTHSKVAAARSKVQEYLLLGY